jgi:hypothetical protein
MGTLITREDQINLLDPLLELASGDVNICELITRAFVAGKRSGIKEGEKTDD